MLRQWSNTAGAGCTGASARKKHLSQLARHFKEPH
jgi:hypothetical protein